MKQVPKLNYMSIIVTNYGESDTENSKPHRNNEKCALEIERSIKGLENVFRSKSKSAGLLSNI